MPTASSCGTVEGARPSPFGMWLLAPGDATAHYFLDGLNQCHCKQRTRHRKAVQATRNPFQVPAYQVHAPFCGDCLAINKRRWLSPDGHLPAAKQEAQS